LVLPDPDDAPALPSQLSEIVPVPLSGLFDLAAPENLNCRSPGRETVAVPEVAVYKHGNSLSTERNVRLAWKVGRVLPEAVTAPMKGGPDKPLDPGVFAPHPGHAVASLFSGEVVRHGLCRLRP
jgi:hypothetical protein